MAQLKEYVRKLWPPKQTYIRIPLDEVLLSHIDVHNHTLRLTKTGFLFQTYLWICRHKCLFTFIIFIGIPVLLYTFLLLLSTTQVLLPKDIRSNNIRRLLLVVAHPDDECLFFSPTLRAFQAQHNIELSLLVFSRGNHVGLGNTRARELLGSCQALNIPRERCLSLDLPNIQDNPKIWWSQQELIPIITRYIDLWSIDLLISFDRQGVSGHINHRAVGLAVREIITSGNHTKVKIAYELQSVSLLRKYSSIIDVYFVFISFLPRILRALFSSIIPFNLISSPNSSRVLLLSTPHDYMTSRTAFASHLSQYSWDRHIYLIASRYMFINELNYIEKKIVGQ
ncbi:unnamed protein product [Adineta ricciae]|uniref:N-acetylglucosaminylphosphatidylinositol deacetylase n=1 Tax=Adineta ricciae TaxID=249248 RepID=A0A813R568_ADIRI|nr:unnamed protein product [Adineta ricciae]CAF0817979.1 unnamed protein product [Adineta ricciae]